jgi:very-short-patch-repair endonuclease/predicted transcriptional regulator of viral defense system
LAKLAERQYGVVSYRQLRELGYSKGAIGRDSGAKLLCRVHRGVYAVGHLSLSRRGRCLAAVLACGPGSVLSHVSAAWLWRLRAHLPAEVEVSAVRTGGKRPGICVHHAPTLLAGDRVEVDGIPATTLPRTLLDLAVSGPARNLEHAIERAERHDLLDLDEIDGMLRRRQRRVAGSRRLLDALEIYRDPGFTRSRAELLFLDVVRRAGLPRPSTNVFVAGYELDAYWEMERFAVEVDGWDTHKTRAAFEADPVRQEDLKLAGIDSIRLTARRIERKPQAVGRRLSELLSQRRKQLRI